MLMIPDLDHTTCVYSGHRSCLKLIRPLHTAFMAAKRLFEGRAEDESKLQTHAKHSQLSLSLKHCSARFTQQPEAHCAARSAILLGTSFFVPDASYDATFRASIAVKAFMHGHQFGIQRLLI